MKKLQIYFLLFYVFAATAIYAGMEWVEKVAQDIHETFKNQQINDDDNNVMSVWYGPYITKYDPHFFDNEKNDDTDYELILLRKIEEHGYKCVRNRGNFRYIHCLKKG